MKVILAILLLLIANPVYAADNFNNSTTAQVEFKKSTNYDMGTTTVMAWIMPRSFGGGSKGRIAQTDTDTTGGWLFNVENAAATAALQVIFGVTGTGLISQNNTVVLNTWQCVAFTYATTDKTVRFYVNGFPRGTAVSTTNPTASTQNLLLGNNHTRSGRAFDGLMYDVKMWQRQLNAQEIRANCYQFAPVNFGSLVLWAPLYGSGPNERDYSQFRAIGTSSATYIPIKNSSGRDPAISLW